MHGDRRAVHVGDRTRGEAGLQVVGDLGHPDDEPLALDVTPDGPVGATSVLGFAGFQTGIVSGDVSHGAAISLFMLPVLLIVVVAMLRFIRRREI